MLKAVNRIAGSAAFAYGSVLLIQSKLLWWIWEHKDLTAGDEYGYFVDASRWADGLELSPAWSPLYQAFFGSLKWFIGGTYEVAIAHRVLIALGVTALVLAVFRRLLTPGVAWLLAVWWAVLPINFDQLYAVHPFGLIPILVAVLIAAWRPTLTGRAAVFGVFLLATVLVRNEMVVTVVAWALLWIGYEFYLRREGAGESLRRLAYAVAIPIGVAAVVGALTLLSYPGEPTRVSASDSFKIRSEGAVCQMYAIGYVQRKDDFTGDPYYQCDQLMQRDFGEPRPSLVEAVAENPGAMADHFLWNARIAPYGVQLGLFNEMSGSSDKDPDFISVISDSRFSFFASLLVLVLLAVGGTLLWRERGWWWQERIEPKAWAWAALFAGALTSIGVMVIQHPRPAYMFPLIVLLMAVIGLCALALVKRWPLLGRGTPLMPLAALILIVALPPRFDSDYVTTFTDGGRPLKDMVDRLAPYRSELEAPGARLLAARGAEGCSYLGEADPCEALSIPPGQLVHAGPALERRLDEERISHIYAAEADLDDPPVEQGLARLQGAGWALVASGDPDGEPWVLLRRR